jgi:hypothetical protein
VVDERVLVAHASWVAGVVVVEIPARQDHPAVSGADRREPAEQSSLAQRFGSLRRTGHASALRWSEAQIGRGGQDGDHSSILPSTADTSGAPLTRS